MSYLASPASLLQWLRHKKRRFLVDELADIVAARLPATTEELVRMLQGMRDPINSKAAALSDYQAREILAKRGADLLVLDPKTFRARFIIRECLRNGGQGSVFKVQDVVHPSRRIVVLKRMVWSSKQEELRFDREVAAYKAIGQHPHVAHFYGYFRTAADEGYIVTEFVEGTTLDEAVFTRIRKSGGVSVLQALEWLEQIASGLAAAHGIPGRPVIHRDVKPNNLLLEFDSMTIKLLDFGMSKTLLPAEETVDLVRTQAGSRLGTRAWMPPEQFVSARDAAAPSDVFAFGCVAFFLFFGVPPCYPALGFTWADFEGTQSRLQAILDARAPLRPDLPVRLLTLIRKCLSPAMVDRPASAVELVAELAALRPVIGHHPLHGCKGDIADFRRFVEDALIDTRRELTGMSDVPYVADQFAELARNLLERMNPIEAKLPVSAVNALNELIRRMNVWERELRGGQKPVSAIIQEFTQQFPAVRSGILEVLFAFQYGR
ncbi:MAG: serine/threonine-protein kinase [Gemmataceae bacterium]